MEEMLMPEQQPGTEEESLEKKQKKEKKKKEEKEAKEAKEMMTVERTELALFRTQLAMIRTTTTLTTFGFALYKLLEERMRLPGEHPVLQFITPRAIGVIMFTTGLFGLSTSSFNYMKVLKRLNRFTPARYRSPVMIMTYVILALTMLLLYGALMGK